MGVSRNTLVAIGCVMGFLAGGMAFADQHRIPDYETARDVFWEELYEDGGDSLYCFRDAHRSGSFNVEHVFAASWMKGAAGCSGSSRDECRRRSQRFNHMEGDLHNLYPALASVNSRRSNYGFNILHGRSNGSCDFEVNTNFRLAEPDPRSRGNIARSILYMLQEYNIDWHDTPIDDINLLYRWHCDDPVSSEERWRNDWIGAKQRTRNSYIDRPQQVDCTRVPDYPED